MTDENATEEATPETTEIENEAEQTTEQSDSSSEEALSPESQEAVQKRINKITAEKHGFKEDAERTRAENEELKKRLGELEEPTPEGAPTLEQYDFDETKHNEATIKYEVEKQLKDRESQRETDDLVASRKKKVAAFNAKEDEYSAANEGYRSAVSHLPRFRPDTLDAIYSLDNGPQTVQYLGTHLDVADEIAGLPPVQAAVKIGQIAAKISANPKLVSLTSAPDPVKVISGAGEISKDLSEMSMEEIDNL